MTYSLFGYGVKEEQNSRALRKKETEGEGVPVLNFEGGPGILLWNFRGVPGPPSKSKSGTQDTLKV